MDQDNQKPGKGFEIAMALVSAAALALYLAMFALTGLGADEKAALEARRAKLADMVSGKSPLASPSAVKAWRDYRAGLEGKKSEIDAFLAGRDLNLEKFFPEFDPRRGGGDGFKVLYTGKTDLLYRRAAPVVATDMNGQTLPAREVFTFDEWKNYSPSKEEFSIAQKKFWILEAVVDVLLAINSRELEHHLAPVLTKAEAVNPPSELPAGSVSEEISARVEALLDARDVPALLSGILGPGKHQLLTRLKSLKVEKTETLPSEIIFEVEEGAKADTRPEKFLKRVKVSLAFEVVDYRQEVSK